MALYVLDGAAWLVVSLDGFQLASVPLVARPVPDVSHRVPRAQLRMDSRLEGLDAGHVAGQLGDEVQM